MKYRKIPAVQGRVHYFQDVPLHWSLVIGVPSPVPCPLPDPRTPSPVFCSRPYGRNVLPILSTPSPVACPHPRPQHPLIVRSSAAVKCDRASLFAAHCADHQYTVGPAKSANFAILGSIICRLDQRFVPFGLMPSTNADPIAYRFVHLIAIKSKIRVCHIRIIIFV